MNKIIVIASLIILSLTIIFWKGVELRPECEFMAVGTVHAQHKISSGYDPKILFNLISNYRPDVIFLEITNQNNWADSSPEMKLIGNIAKTLNIKVIPFDVPTDEKAFSNPKMKELRQGLQSSVGGFSFLEIHSEKTMDLLLDFYQKREEVLGVNNSYDKREKSMNDTITKQLTKRGMSFSGYTHLGHINRELKEHCVLIDPREFSKETETNENYLHIYSDTIEDWKEIKTKINNDERKFKRIEAFLENDNEHTETR